MTRNVFFLMAMALFALFGVGCCPVTPLNLSIELDKSFQAKYPNQIVDVDLVMVGPNEQARWENASMTNYWQSGNGMRNTLPTKTLEFDTSKSDPQVVASGDAIWDKWLADASSSAPPHLYVLVQYKGTHDPAKEDKPGNLDFRRQILPTKKCQYDGGPFSGSPSVKIVVNSDRVMTLTTIKPE
jgi:hypothetical protein